MILIGGPSRHFYWNDRQVIRSLCRVMENSSVAWQLVTSRRTPERFLRLWSTLGPKRVEVRSTPADSNWLSETLGECGKVWVTSDSMSMIYEALTSGATTGLIPLRARMGSRVAIEVQRLIDEQQVVLPQTPDRAVCPAFPLVGQTEADRCAVEILQRCLLSVERAAAWEPESDGPMELSVGGTRVRWTSLGCSDAVSGGSSGVNSAPVLLH
jgi:mitochondrial fission protein ELM1